MSNVIQGNNGDWVLTDHALVVTTDPDVCLCQRLNNRLNFWLSQWYQDTRQGFPWVQEILGVMSPNLNAVAQLFISMFLETPGVAAVQSASVDLVVSTRTPNSIVRGNLEHGSRSHGWLGLPFYRHVGRERAIMTLSNVGLLDSGFVAPTIDEIQTDMANYLTANFDPR